MNLSAGTVDAKKQTRISKCNVDSFCTLSSYTKSNSHCSEILVWFITLILHQATTMRLLVFHQLTLEDYMRAGELTHYLIIIIIHNLIYCYTCQMIVIYKNKSLYSIETLLTMFLWSILVILSKACAKSFICCLLK